MNLLHQEGLLNQAQDLIGNKAVWTSHGNTFAHINNKYFKIETDEDIRNLTKTEDGIEESVYTEDTDETVFPNQQERKFTASPTTKKMNEVDPQPPDLITSKQEIKGNLRNYLSRIKIHEVI